MKYNNHYHNLETGQPTNMRFTPMNPNYEGEPITKAEIISSLSEIYLQGIFTEEQFLRYCELAEQKMK